MASKEKMSASLDLRGLDLVTPVDMLADGRSPWAINFRLYAQQADDRRVAVSSRKGPGYYTTPLSETLSDSTQSSVGASTAKVGLVTNIHAQPLTAASDGLVTRIDVSVGNLDLASGPLMVQIWSDNAGPAKLLSESSILSGNIGLTVDYVTARFVKSVAMELGVKYWIVLRIQDDGKNEYTLSTTTDGTPAWTSDSSLSALTEQAYSINYKVYTTTDSVDKGSYRFNRESGDNRTLVAYDDTMYYIDEGSKSLTPIVSGLNPLATEYSFTNGDGKAFWVNGYDQLTAWDGTLESDHSNIVQNPDFETNTSGWSNVASTISRVTTQQHSGTASLQVATTTTAETGTKYQFPFEAYKKYKITFWAKAAASRNLFFRFTGNADTSLDNLTTSWQKYEFYYIPTAVDTASTRGAVFRFNNVTGNVWIDDVSIQETGIEHIIDPELPILSDVLMHKDRLFGVVKADKNKLVWSENPGTPTHDPTGVIPTVKQEQWYYAWLSVSFWYVPRPLNDSPMTALVSFQDALTIFTQDNKYVFSGYDRGDFYLRQSTGVKGALSKRGVTSDENRIYFVADDGLYEYNGSSDEKISMLASPLFDGCGHKEMITPTIWKNQVRFYMASQGSNVNDTCLIYDKDVNELLYDTETYVNRALYYNDADDNQQLAEFSSLTPSIFFAEQGYNSLGAPIDFEYRLKYDSMGSPMQRKRLKRYYPILQGTDSTFTVRLDMDKNFEDSPKVKEQLLTVNGATWGNFMWGDGTLYGFDKSFKPKRQSYSGYAYYWQLRVKRKGVNNRVAFIGAQFSYKLKRL